MTYIDSTGLGLMVGSAREAASEGRTMELRHSHRRVDQVLELTGLDWLFPRR